MFEFLKGKKNESNKKEDNKDDKNSIPPEEYVDVTLSKDYKENLKKFKAYLKDSSDAIFREFKLGVDEIKCALVYIDGLTDHTILHQHIMLPLMQGVGQLEKPNQIETSKSDAYTTIKEHILTVSEIKEVSTFDKAMFFIMSGETALIIDGSKEIIIANTRGWASRSITEPESESVVRGPRDGFVETLRMNTAMLRRKCRDVNMVLKVVQVGRRTKTDIGIVYIKGIVNPKLVEEVEKRINNIDVDQILETGQIEQFIQDSIWSPFPQLQTTERPDKSIAAMTEGRVVILVDGTPFALIAPATLNQMLQSAEDYYERWYIGSLLRLLRWFGMFLAVFGPALYIATTSFHPEMLPTSLVLTIAASRENLPFPAIVEAGLMEITIELLREAGARLPKAIGQTIGIVGAIIIGDAAVRAGIASPILIVVVAVTAIASFVIPSYSVAITFRLLRFPLMVLAAIFGLYGVMLGFILITVHLAKLKSFGYDYNSPFMPVLFGDMKDTLFRVPIQYMKKRPEGMDVLDEYRQPRKGGE